MLFYQMGDGLQSTAGKRPWDDDVDAQSRLPALLNGSYYRDALCEYSALFAIAKQIDHVHKNPWIGFQPWWATSRNVGWFFPLAKVLFQTGL
jgi:hypothetical protein